MVGFGQLLVELESHAESFAVLRGKVSAGGEFVEDAVVEARDFFVVEDVGEEGAGEAAVAAEKLSAEGREVVNTVALIP